MVGDLSSGAELTRITSEIALRSDPGEGYAKWRRRIHAVASNQAKTGNGTALVALICAATRPGRTVDRRPGADVVRDELNQILSLVSLKILPDWRVVKAKKATTDPEALARSERLHKILQQHRAHAEVLAYCREQLLRNDHYETVFEATKGLGARIRAETGIDAGAHPLVGHTMAGPSPVLRINNGRTRAKRDEQLSVTNLAKGLLSALRNPVAHEPKLQWAMSELDVLGTLSMIHRRLDAAVLTSGEAV